MSSAAYRTAREVVKPAEFWETMDAWPLYAGTKNLARYFFLADCLKRTQTVPGHLVECGIWKGATTCFIAKWLELYVPKSQKMIHAFDNFEGMAEANYRGEHQTLLSFLSLNAVSHRVHIHVGDVAVGLPDVAESNPELRLSFALLDIGLYETTKAGLDFVHPRLSQNGIIVLDEWNHPKWPGETRAVTEFLEEYGHLYIQEATPVEQPSLVLVRR